jgi:hypothetical protein
MPHILLESGSLVHKRYPIGYPSYIRIEVRLCRKRHLFQPNAACETVGGAHIAATDAKCRRIKVDRLLDSTSGQVRI